MNNVSSPDPSDAGIEHQIKALGADKFPRVTPEDLQANIVGEYYFTAQDGVTVALPLQYVPNDHDTTLGLLTFCVLVLKNGFTVVGKSAVASPENFKPEIGRQVARNNAVNEIWPVMGYELKERLYRKQQAISKGSSPLRAEDLATTMNVLRAAPASEDFPLGKACDLSGEGPCEGCQ